MDFLISSEILDKNQHGFLKNKSTITAIFEFLNQLLNELDTGHFVLALFMDLSKAFDCVEHQILLNKLELLGLRGIVHQLISHYLENRKQYVASNSSKGFCQSAMLANDIGIPQGSILGPLFFILYVNDLVMQQENIFVTKYADDTSFLINNKQKDPLVHETNKLLQEVNVWFCKNKLKLNPNKTNVIGFQLNNRNDKYCNMPLVCNNENLSLTNHAKLLGLIIDKNLQWTEHISQMCKKLSKINFALRILRTCSGMVTLKSVYYAHFQSVLMYSIKF